MTVTHAYIADLSRERPAMPNRADAVALVAVCGASERDGSELRCFGMRRLAETWERAGAHVDCPACRTEVRRLLAGRGCCDAHTERMRVLEEWIRLHPLRGEGDSLKAEARRREEAERAAKAKVKKAAAPERVMGLCEFCGADAVAVHDYTCSAVACRIKRARVTRRKRERRAAS